MQLLVVAATQNEIKPLMDKQGEFKNVQLDFLITGVGMVATTFSLTQKLMSSNYDLVINAGIAGCFNTDVEIGDVVEVVEDRIYEMGAEDNDNFLSAHEMGLVEHGQVVLRSNHNLNLPLKKVTGITVNKVHGNAASIENAKSLVNPDVESMEGAAVFYVCDMLKIPCVQIRAISNKVEPRNKDNWNIYLAITNLNVDLENIIQQL